MKIQVIENIKVYIISPIIGLMFAVALAYFLFGLYEFVAGADNEDRVKQGRQHIFWGLIGMFIMVSAFGIMNLLCTTINC